MRKQIVGAMIVLMILISTYIGSEISKTGYSDTVSEGDSGKEGKVTVVSAGDSGKEGEVTVVSEG
ncbi:MAG: hypothetical protein LUE29_05520, partial [Lachnospiraceae bacterium]|nr:hypothetical protein [Lachnospiraceae bacterium]